MYGWNIFPPCGRVGPEHGNGLRGWTVLVHGNSETHGLFFFGPMVGSRRGRGKRVSTACFVFFFFLSTEGFVTNGSWFYCFLFFWRDDTHSRSLAFSLIFKHVVMNMMRLWMIEEESFSTIKFFPSTSTVVHVQSTSGYITCFACPYRALGKKLFSHDD